jgi:hypothetical protein
MSLHQRMLSLPGLTRQSIESKDVVLFAMDARVKPAHDIGAGDAT